jgi:hypothetical protein
MRLQKIYIRRPWNDEKRLEGSVEFAGKSGEISLHLTDELSRRVLEVVADELVASSRQVAQDLTREIIEAHAPALPAGEVGDED